MNGGIPIFYLHLQKRMLEKADRGNVVSTKDARALMYKYNIPKLLRPIIIKEMHELDLLSIQNRRKVKIINTKRISLLEDSSKLYRLGGMPSSRNWIETWTRTK